MTKDFRGQELEVGDRVLYVSSTHHYRRYVAKVIKIQKRVLILSEDPKVAHPEWVESTSCFLVEVFKNELPEHIMSEVRRALTVTEL